MSGLYSLNVRASTFDMYLAVQSIGVVVIFILLYMVYIIVRGVRGTKSGYHRSKADRPLWVLGLVISGSLWLLMATLYTGVLTMTPEDSWACTYILFLGQHAAFILWIMLVLYKLIRKFWQYRLVGKRPPHALLAIFLPVSIYWTLLGTLSFFATCSRDSNDLCHVEQNWQWPVYLSLVLYILLFVVLLIKIRRTVGDHHEVIRYSIFLSTSFLYPFVELIVHMTPLDTMVGAHQALLGLLLLIVFGNLAHIFILILRGKHRPVKKEGILPQDTRRSPTNVSLSSLSSTPSTPPTGPALDMVNTVMAEGSLEPPNATDLPPPLLQRPRRTDQLMPDFERYVEGLPDEVSEKVDRNRGYFAYRSRPRTRTIVEFDIDRAETYIKPPS